MLQKRLALSIWALAFSVAGSCAPAPSSTPRPPAAPASVTINPVEIGTLESQGVTAIPHAAPATFTPYPTDPAPAGASGGSPSSSAQATPAALDPPINPLTGRPASDPLLLERRPLAIKISNYPREIRPQYGLNEADVVYEYYIEWLNTRFIGIFYGNDASQIGPVRSGRYFDEHILRMYHAYYVFNYADPREYAYFLGGDLQKWLVVPGYGGCPPFFQDRVSKTITDVRHYETYFDSSRFGACPSAQNSDNARPALRSGLFSPQPPAGGAEVNRIFTHYSSCDYNYWKYDPATTRYLRFQEISPNQAPEHVDDCSDSPETYAPLVDALVNEQVSADNVVVIFVSHTFANEGEQQDEVYHINLVDSGKAFVFRDGLGMPARWMRTDIDQPLSITTDSGTPVYLKPGRTFYEIIGETSTAWSDGMDWHFDFQTP